MRRSNPSCRVDGVLYEVVKVLLTAVLVVATGDTAKVANRASSIFWYVLPSLVLFIVLPPLLLRGVGFWPSLAIASAATFAAYICMSAMLARFGITF
jgi:hypothetical protein